MTCLAIAAIGLHLASVHTDRPTNPVYGPEYNNINPGAYVKAECGLTAGLYYNSIRKMTGYVAYTYDPAGLPLFASVGVATGYDRPVTPIAMAGLRVDAGSYRLRVGYIPKVGKTNDTHVFHLMIERKF